MFYDRLIMFQWSATQAQATGEFTDEEKNITQQVA